MEASRKAYYYTYIESKPPSHREGKSELWKYKRPEPADSVRQGMFARGRREVKAVHVLRTYFLHIDSTHGSGEPLISEPIVHRRIANKLLGISSI